MKFLVKFSIPVVYSVYLSFLIGGLLQATRSRYLILGLFFFLLLEYLFSVVYKKNITPGRVDKKRIVYSFFIGLIILLAGHRQLIPKNPKSDKIVVSVTAMGDKDKEAKSTEVWILDLKNNGVSIGTNSIAIDSSWERRGTSILSYKHQPAQLNIVIDNPSNAAITFLKHAWSGKVKIKVAGHEELVDLYDAGEGYRYDMAVNEQLTGKPLYTYLFFVLALFFFCSVVYGCLTLTAHKTKNISLFTILLGLVLFSLQDYLSLSTLEAVLLLCLSFVTGRMTGMALQSDYVKNNFKKRDIALLSIIALYAGFACIGSDLFFTNKPIDIFAVCYFLIFAVWFLSVGISFLHITYQLSQRFSVTGGENGPASGIKLWFLFFLILALVWCVYLSAFWPGCMSADSVDQWAQATGAISWNNWHPVFHTLFNKCLISVYKSPASIAIGQIVFMSAVMASFLLFLHRKGFPAKWLLLFTVVFSLLPNNGILMITLWKDIPFTISLLWLTFVLIKIVTNPRYFKHWTAIPEVVLTLIGTALFRFNGMLVYVVVLAALLFYFFKYRQRAVLVSAFLTVVLLILYNTLVLKRPDVIPTPASIKLIAPVHGIAAVIKDKESLTPEVEKTMESVLPKETWDTMYSPYSALDYIFQTHNTLIKNLSEVPAGKALGMYFTTFLHHPATVIKDRLQGCDNLWNVSRPDDIFNLRYVTGIDNNNLGVVQKPGRLKPFFIKSLHATEKIGEIFVWRVGIYNIFILLLLFFVYKNAKRKYLLMFLPWLGCALSLLPSMVDQDYRYVYFVFVLFWFLWFMVISGFKLLPGKTGSN